LIRLYRLQCDWSTRNRFHNNNSATINLLRIKKGLDIPIAGEPEQVVMPGNGISRVASVGRDFIGLKPSMQVQVGDRVTLGQPLFTDRRNPGVRFVAPGTGSVIEINRGERRILQSVVIELDAPEDPDAAESFNAYTAEELENIGSAQVREDLIVSGQWVGFRTRPFSKVPGVEDSPAAIFITALDTNPLAPDPLVVISRQAQAFRDGLQVICRLADVKVHLCIAADAAIDTPVASNLVVTEFAGPHPAGLAGTHIHFLEPVSATRQVWTIGYQGVIAIGQLFRTGRLWTERVISLAGPIVNKPRLIATRSGASTEDLVAGELQNVKARIIAGPLLSGRRAAGWGAYLGGHHSQVIALGEGGQREFFSWLAPGFNKFSVVRVYLSSLFGSRKRFAMTTSQNGSSRAMVPIGVYESVMPMDILPTQLLRALLVRDTVAAQELGCLELDEEDLALCSFVCPGKYDYGPALRANLNLIEKEG
jgi:Na+-transporting NADH:ubiquinone oxidoreductase subunit A